MPWSNAMLYVYVYDVNISSVCIIHCSSHLHQSSYSVMCVKDVLCGSHIPQWCISYPLPYIDAETHQIALAELSHPQQWQEEGCYPGFSISSLWCQLTHWMDIGFLLPSVNLPANDPSTYAAAGWLSFFSVNIVKWADSIVGILIGWLWREMMKDFAVSSKSASLMNISPSTSAMLGKSFVSRVFSVLILPLPFGYEVAPPS